MAVEGTIVGGRYELGELLGQGGMSQVRSARDLRIGRPVAVKLLRPELVRDPTFEGRFRREAQSAASLHNPGIVAVYDTGEEMVGGFLTPYIVMELVEGRTLRDVVAMDGRMPAAEAVRITSAVCAALDEAHRAGIVHRDVKPGNVMLTPDGGVKVMDFGIARATSTSVTLTQTATVVGTALYLSPEQARGEHVDARSDVYSTGCLLYELLAGTPPFTGESSVAIAYQHVREDPTPPSRFAPDIPPALDAVVLKALAKNPADRYQSAGELRDDLQRVAAGRPVSAAPAAHAAGNEVRPPPPTTVLVREPPRRGRRGAAYSLLALATVAVFVVALLIARSLLAGSNTELETPKVTGETLQDAQAVLSQAGLRVGDVNYRFSKDKRGGIVLSQDPSHPILLGRGQAVDLVVSKGVHYIQVPADLIGEQRAQAEAEITAAGLKVGKVVGVNSRDPVGQVLSVDPTAGAQAPIGSSVTLTVSNAKEPVPGVVGQDADSGATRLQHSQFAVVERDYSTYNPSHPVGQIEAQSPSAGTLATVNSTVVIYLNEPPPPPAKKSSSPGPTTSSSPGKTGKPGH